MPSTEKYFLYLSQILGRSVYQADRQKIGKVIDLAISSKSRTAYPEVIGLLVSNKTSSTPYLIWWDKIANFEEDIILHPSTEQASNQFTDQSGLLLLKQTFLDKQIVDIFGSKVVRVNDLHLLKESGKLWVVHVDIGTRGLLRRLGWEEVIDKIMQWLFSYKMSERLISWKFVYPVTTSGDSSMVNKQAVQLIIPHDKLSNLHPVDLAEILMDLGRKERLTMLQALDAKTIGEVLGRLSGNERRILFDSIGTKAADVVSAMSPDEAADFLLTIPKKKREEILQLIPKKKSEDLNKLLAHQEETAGALMTTEFLKFSSATTIEEVLKEVRQKATTTEVIYYIYALDEQEHLVGVTTLRRLISAEPGQKLFDIMHTQPIKVKTSTKIGRIRKIFTKYYFGAIPVVDHKNKLVGVITAKDALRA